MPKWKMETLSTKKSDEAQTAQISTSVDIFKNFAQQISFFDRAFQFCTGPKGKGT